ncbi:HEAT repeat domain-containing protein [Deinococcus frigens]|uniref:HEAT repeat domain-containing protein n=1 Tax=Deinococcus frigens TaxID=249403 RepID=UPI0004972328|nr:HEAT repeat domain-containing protein [Deinococcus frigens]
MSAAFSLPAAPSPEHLKGQAKALLKAVHASEADAVQRFAAQMPGRVTVHPLKLADAQFVLAREYSFSSWPRLKAYVEALPQRTLRRKDPSVRQRFIRELAVRILVMSADSQALGREFARMPLRDILAVRDELSQSEQLPAVVDSLLVGLADTRARVRFDCAGALDHFANARCAEPLRRRLQDPVPRVRRSALHSLSCDACKLSPLNAGPDFLPTLLDLVLNDPSIRVRRAAVLMLETYAQMEQVLDLLSGLSDSDDTVISRSARQILGRRT